MKGSKFLVYLNDYGTNFSRTLLHGVKLAYLEYVKLFIYFLVW
jgi:hypothetical protein